MRISDLKIQTMARYVSDLIKGKEVLDKKFGWL